MEIALPYRDRKRPLWLLSLFVPMLGLIGPALYLLVSPHQAWLWLSPVFFYLGVPVIDALLGEDPSNPPEDAVPALEADPYYRWITYLLVPLLWAAFIASRPVALSGWLATNTQMAMNEAHSTGTSR